MSVAQAYSDQDSMRALYVHSRGQQGSQQRAETAGKMAEASGLYRQRHLTYGGGQYQSGSSYTELNAMAYAPSADVHMERHALSSAQNDTYELEKLNFQLSLINAAGSMTAELHDVIADLTERTADLTADQMAKFTAVIFNTYQLQQANEGRIELTQSEMIEFGNQTLDMMTDLALDGVLPADLKTKMVDVIKETAMQFDLPALDARIERFEEETSPEAMLAHSIDALKMTLQAMLDTDDLDDDTRQEIEDLMEKLDAHEEGEPLPRDIVKALQALSDKMQDIAMAGVLSSDMESLSERLLGDVETVIEANTELRAERSGLTVSQIKAIDAYLDRLEEIAEALPDSDMDIKDMIAEAVMLMDQNPVSVEATAALEQTLQALDNPEISAALADKGLSAGLPIVRQQGQFIQKTMTDRIAARDQVSTSLVREQTTTYAALKTLRQAMMSTLMPANVNAKPAAQPYVGAGPQPTQNPDVKPEVKVDPKVKPSPTSQDDTKPDAKVKPEEKGSPQQPEDKTPPSNDGKGEPSQAANTGANHQADQPSTPVQEPPQTLADHPIIAAIDKAMDAVVKAPAKMATAVLEVANMVGGQAIAAMAKTNDGVKEALKTATKTVDGFIKESVKSMAEKAGKPVEFVRDQVSSMLDKVKDKFEALKQPKDQPKPEEPTYKDFSAESKKTASNIFSGGSDIDSRTIQSAIKDKCASCVSAFCDACKGGGDLLNKLNPFKPSNLTSVFSKASGLFSREDNDFNAAPKPSSPK